MTVVQKSRRTGFTWGVGADAVLTSAAARSAGGMDTLYIGYNLDMAREFIDVCAMWARAFGQAASSVGEFVFQDQAEDGSTRAIGAFRVTFASGYEICALSSRPRSLRGRQGYVVIDEAAFHDQLDELLKAALALLMWGGKVLVISTHDGDLNPFAILCNDIATGRRPGVLITVTFDQALADGLYQRICLVRGQNWSPEAQAAWREQIIAFYGDAAGEELFVVPATGAGAFLPAALIERQQRDGIPVLRWAAEAGFELRGEVERDAIIAAWIQTQIAPHLARLNPRQRSFLGEDFALVGDLTVFWPVQVDEVMRRVPPFVIELWRMPYRHQKQILWWLLDRLPNLVALKMDAGGNGAVLAQETALHYGLERVDQVKISTAWYAQTGSYYKAGFVDGLVVLPRDLDIYNDHRSIKLVGGIPHIERAPKSTAKGEDAAAAKAGRGNSRHGDSAIAAMMAYISSLMDVEEYGYQPIKPAANLNRAGHYDDDLPNGPANFLTGWR